MVPVSPTTGTTFFPLDHIDSVHQTNEQDQHLDEDDDELIVTPTGSNQHLNGGDSQAEKGQVKTEGTETLRRRKTLPAEERDWKEDIVLWDNKSDVSTMTTFNFLHMKLQKSLTLKWMNSPRIPRIGPSSTNMELQS